MESEKLIASLGIDPNGIDHNFHLSKTWADVFWSRRFRHIGRFDPELPYVIDFSPSRMLEIGSAYGRILRKLTYVLSDADVMGIEICPYFENYQEKFLGGEYDIITGDIYTYEFEGKFDVILLPMNTFPSFLHVSLPQLLSKLRSLCSNLIFSTHHYRPLEGDARILSTDTETISELGLEVKYVTLGPFKYVGGYWTETLHIFSEQRIFLTRRYIHRPDYLRKRLEDAGFVVKQIDDTSHSLVWVCS